MTRDELSTLLLLDVVPPIKEIRGVTEDSRRVRPGCLFVAVRGGNEDGHAFVADAVARGAVGVLGDQSGLQELCGIPYIYRVDPRRDAALIAQALAGFPTRSLCVIGITGTNGKTSTACLVQNVLTRTGHPCANFGTLGYDLGDGREEARHTTPFGEDLANLFVRAATAGNSHVVMEVSSHALAQGRTEGVSFRVGAFTNLTRDHLDYHGTMENYLRAKLRLFEQLRREIEGSNQAQCRFAVVNAEDPAAPRVIAASPETCYTYGSGGVIRGENERVSPGGIAFRICSPWGDGQVHLHLAGRHNLLNALCAFGICAGLGVPVDEVIAGLEGLSSVPGRFEAVKAGQDFTVIVDYAHTDDGLRNALQAARDICSGKLMVVFGCGGDRDKGKRPKMGTVAAELADFTILTSDNPRTEDPVRILLDIELGMQRAGKRKGDDYLVIESREEALREAIFMARTGDLVLIAGKGHETYQIVGSERRHFDDREIARKFIEDRLK